MIHYDHCYDFICNLVLVVKALDVGLDEACQNGLENATHNENEKLNHKLLIKKHD